MVDYASSASLESIDRSTDTGRIAENIRIVHNWLTSQVVVLKEAMERSRLISIESKAEQVNSDLKTVPLTWQSHVRG